jgi:hypothetical protein
MAAQVGERIGASHQLADLGIVRMDDVIVGRVVDHLGNELIAALRECLHETRRSGLIVEGAPHFENVAPQYFRLHERIGPDCRKQLILRDQSSRAVDQVLQDGERLGHQRHAGVASPQALIRRIQTEWSERLHG